MIQHNDNLADTKFEFFFRCYEITLNWVGLKKRGKRYELNRFCLNYV